MMLYEDIHDVSIETDLTREFGKQYADFAIVRGTISALRIPYATLDILYA